MTASVSAINSESARAEAMASTILGMSIGFMELLSIYIGDRLGYYRVLAGAGAQTSAGLAEASGTSERYAREWLEQQATAGILDVIDHGEVATRAFLLPPAMAPMFTGTDSLEYLTPLVRLTYGISTVMPALLEAFRTGGGVDYADYGADTRDGIAGMNRVMFINELVSTWMPQLPDIHARLRDASRPARVADIGCGTGWSSISLAQGYPAIEVDGFDLDEASIATAQELSRGLGLDNRLRFATRNAGDLELSGTYDFVTAFECIHDMADPVGVLTAMRRLAGPGGTVMVADERVADTLSPGGDEVERLMYGFSILHCLPVGLAESPSAGTGTVMRVSTFREYARQAGFRDVDVLPIDNLFWRFYRLTA